MLNLNPLHPEYYVTFAVILIALALALWYWMRFSVTRQSYLGWIAICTAIWGVFYLLEQLLPEIDLKRQMENVQFSVLFVMPVLTLFFTFDFINRPITRTQKNFVWVEPVAMLFILWTDAYTHWFRQGVSFLSQPVSQSPLFSIHGWAYWVSGGYSVLLFLICIALVVRELIKVPYWQRIRTGFLLIALVTVVVGVLAMIPGDLSSRGTWLMLAGSILSQLILLTGASQRQTMALIPIARETVLEQIQDPVIITNIRGEIAALNVEAQKLPGFSSPKVMGVKLTSISPQWQALLPDLQSTQRMQHEFKMDIPTGTRYYDADVSPVKDNRQLVVGSLIVLHDTTRQMLAQQELAVLRAVTDEFNQANDLPAAIKSALGKVCELSSCQYALIRLIDDRGNLKQAFACDPASKGEPFLELETGAFTGKWEGASNAEGSKFDTEPGVLTLVSVRSEEAAGRRISIPLKVSNSELGVLELFYQQGPEPDENSCLHLVNAICSALSVTVERIRLFEAERDQRYVAEKMHVVGQIITSSLDFNKVLDRLLEQLEQLVPYHSAWVLLLRNESLQVVGGRGFGDAGPGVGSRLPLDRSNAAGSVYLDSQPLRLNDVHEEGIVVGTLAGAQIRSWLGVPLRYQDRTIGVLTLDSETPAMFTEEKEHTVQAFADQVSVALENVSLYERALKDANRFEILYRLTQEINANLGQEQVCSAIHRAASSLMLTECFMISLLDEGSHEIFDLYMVDRSIPGTLQRRPASEGLFARVIADGKSRMYNTFGPTEIASSGAILVGEDEEDSITQSLLCVPLRLGSQIKGVISVQSYLPNQYTSSDLEMLELLAGQAAIALENSRLFDEVQQLAITDPLTQIFNRRRFFELADQEFGRSLRYGRPLSIIMIDIDHFKRINDTYGHVIGDQVLQQVARICTQNIRHNDILARYGGEEFVILTPETTAQEALVTCERLRSEVDNGPFATSFGPIHITISLGVVDMVQPCKSFEELLDRSDQAMYSSKQKGCNLTTVWPGIDSLSQSPEAPNVVG